MCFSLFIVPYTFQSSVAAMERRPCRCHKKLLLVTLFFF